MILKDYDTFGGVHAETAAIKNVLAYHGVKAPHTGQPFTEAMLLGIGGGLGAGYILWEFEKYEYASLVLGFRYRWNYSVAFLQNLASRLGAKTEVLETAGRKKAVEHLTQALENGQPPLVWVDLGETAYYHHYLLSVLVVFGFDPEAGEALLDNRAQKPYRLPLDALAAARDKVPSYRNRVMVVEPSGSCDLEAVVTAGIQDCIDYLGAKSTSFALPTLRKWARLMTDANHKKGWPNVFKDRRGLYATLRSIYEGVRHAGTGGDGLRGLYADFLDEAAPILGNGRMATASAAYRALGIKWMELAEAALPDEVEGFKVTKELLDRRAAINLEHGGESLTEIAPLNETLRDLELELNPAFPLSDSDTTELFDSIRKHLEDLYQAENEALEALKQVLGS